MATNKIIYDKDHLEMTLSLHLLQDGDYVVAYSPALEYSSFGKNETEALQRFESGLRILVKELRERNSVEKVITELGWKRESCHKQSYVPRKVAEPRYEGEFINTRSENYALPV